MPRGHRENWRWSQKHTAKSTFRKGECLIMSKPFPKGLSVSDGEGKTAHVWLLELPTTCEPELWQSWNRIRGRSAGRGQEDTKSLQAGMGIRRRCHLPLHLCQLSPPVPALPPFVPFGCVRTFYRCHLMAAVRCPLSHARNAGWRKGSRDDSSTVSSRLWPLELFSHAPPSESLLSCPSSTASTPRGTLRNSYGTQIFPFLCSWAPSAVVTSQALLSPNVQFWPL